MIGLTESKLTNAMNLAFATINIEDSRQARRLAEAMVKDSVEQVSFFP